MPPVGSEVEVRRETGLAMLQLHAQELSEEMVEPVPLAVVVERDEEEVRARELTEPRGAALLLEHRVAERAAQASEDRRANHEVLHVGIVRLEHLGDQEVHDVSARAAEGAHEPGAVADTAEGEPREVETGRPALGSLDEAVDVLVPEPKLEAPVQELVRLL